MLIRDLPDDVHAESVRRASAADQSLLAYLYDLLIRHVSVPSMREWLDSVGELGPLSDSSVIGAEAVAASRAGDDTLLPR